MNTIYRVVWNEATQSWVVASEMAKGRKKASSNRTAMVAAVALAGVGFASAASANGGGLWLCGTDGNQYFGNQSNGTNGNCNVTPGMGWAIGNGSDNTSGNNAISNATARIVGYKNGLLELKGTAGISALNTVTMNSNKITSLAYGTSTNDAVALGQLKSAVSLFGKGATVDSSGNITQPSYVINGTTYNDVGAALDAVTTGGIKYIHTNSTLGDSSAGGTNATAIGPLATAAGQSAVALGNGSNASANNSVALGAGSTTTANLSSAAYNPGSTTLSGTASTANGEVSIGSPTKERRLTNLAAGSSATDAVNVSQLYSEDVKVNREGTTAAAALGGSASYSSTTGAIAAPSYALTNTNSIGGTTGAATDVGTGFSKVDTALGKLDSAVTTASKGFNISTDAGATSQNIAPGGSVNFAAGSNATATRNGNTITLGVVDNPIFTSVTTGDSKLDTSGLVIAGGPSVTASGLSGGSKVISNVANGVAGTDAVNLSQLNAAIGTPSNTPIIFHGNGGTDPQRKLGDTVTIAGNAFTQGTYSSDNLRTQAYSDGSGLALQMADSPVFGGVTINKDGTGRITGVADAVDGTDAINKNMLDKAIGDMPGNPLAVSYDDAGKGTVTFNKGGTPTTLSNVAAGTSGTDAVNVQQLDDKFSEFSDLSEKIKYIKFGSTDAASANAGGNDSVAIGGFANAKVDGAVAIGANSSASGVNSVAIGFGSNAKEANTFSVGAAGNLRRVTNVADGTADNDAATVGQMTDAISDAIAKVTTPAKGLLKAATLQTNFAGATSSLTPDKLIAAGPNGDKLNATDAIGDKAIAAGMDSHAQGDSSVAIGQGVTTQGANSVGLGQAVAVNARAGVVIGVNSDSPSDAPNSVIIGNNSHVLVGGAANSVSIGYNNELAGLNTVVIGSNITALSKNSVVLGAGSGDDSRDNVVSVGIAATKKVPAVNRQIINVAAGTLDTDSVNISQLKGVTAALGGGAAVDPTTGAVKKPTYKVNGVDATGVDGAIAALDSRTTAIAGDALSWDAGSSTYSAKHGDQAQSRITNVADAVDAHDAVNKKTLDDAIANVPTNPLAVSYTSDSKSKIALGDGKGGTTAISGVAAATARDEAVNMGQLQDAGLFDKDGNVLDAVVYDAGSNKTKVTFNSGAAAAVLDNVAAGALNATSKQAVNGSQLFNTAQSMADALGGGSAIDPGTGKISEPTYTVDGKDAKGVDGAVAALDTGVKAAKDGIDGLNADMADAVKYDSAAHDKITLNQGKGAVKLTNVAQGTASTDAVNVGQLDERLSDFDDLATKIKYIKFGNTDANEASANGQNSLAIGGFANAKVDNAIAIGANSTASGANSVAIGFGSNAKEDNTVSVGAAGNQRRITNVADGTDVSDAATVGQMTDAISDAIAKVTTPQKGLLKAATLQAGLLGATSSLTPDKLIAAGPNGDKLNATDAIGDKAIAAGMDSHAQGNSSVAIGQGVTTQGANSVGLGQAVAVNAKAGVVIGVNSDSPSDAPNSVIIGNNSHVLVGGAANSVSIGYNNEVAGLNTVVIGSDITALSKNSVVLGAGSGDDSRDNVVSVGIAATKKAAAVNRQITNVAAGTLDTDSVNVSQLKGVTAALGGGATVDPTTGAVNKPTYSVGGKDVTGVDAAIAALDNQSSTGNPLGVAYDSSDFSKVTLKNKSNGGTTLAGVAAGKNDDEAVNLKQLKDAGIVDPNGNPLDAVVYDAGTNKAKVSFGGGANGTVLDNVAAGALGTTSKQAVNGSQLLATAQSVSDSLGGGSTVDPATGKVGKPVYKVGGQDVTGVGAAIAALDSQSATGNPLGVAYDGADFGKVTLKGDKASGGTTIASVKAGVNNDEAVNVKQLKDAGIIDPNGNSLDAVVYDAGSSKGQVTFGGANGTVLGNVAAGKVNATSKQAVNGSQLFGLAELTAAALGGGSVLDANGNATKPKYTIGGQDYDNVGGALSALNGMASTGNPLGVAYDDTSKGKVTLAGKNSGGTTIAGVKAATQGDEAVNLKQLVDAGVFDDKGNSLAMSYDDASKATATLNKGGKAVKVTNVANATGATDAVNLGQLQDAGVFDKDGNALAVSYDDSSKAQVTFNKGAAAAVLSNVAAGSVTAASSQAINGSQLYATAQSMTAALGGGSSVNPATGAISVPKYKVGGTDVTGVAGAIAALDNQSATGNPLGVAYDDGNFSKITLKGQDNGGTTIAGVKAGVQNDEAVNVKQLKDAGIINDGGSVNTAVTYDHNTDGTTNYNSITLGGGDAGTVIHNIADGTSATDAVNKGQLDAAIAQGGNSAMFAADGNKDTEKASATGTHATAMGANAVASADNSVAVGAGSVADAANTVSVGSVGNERRITNVAAASSATDAVNYGQYQSGLSDTLNQANAYTDSQMQKSWTQVNDSFDRMNNKINQVDRQASRGIASASALINVTPYVPGHTAVNAGVANYRGQNALGVGVSRWSDNGRFNVNAGVSAAQGDGGNAVVRVGVGYVF